MRHYCTLKTECNDQPASAEKKLAFAMLGRAFLDIERLDRIVIKGRPDAHKRQIIHDGWDAVAFFFARKNEIRTFWLIAADADLKLIRWSLLDRYPWIMDKFSRRGGAANERIKKQIEREGGAKFAHGAGKA